MRSRLGWSRAAKTASQLAKTDKLPKFDTEGATFPRFRRATTGYASIPYSSHLPREEFARGAEVPLGLRLNRAWTRPKTQVTCFQRMRIPVSSGVGVRVLRGHRSFLITSLRTVVRVTCTLGLAR